MSDTLLTPEQVTQALNTMLERDDDVDEQDLASDSILAHINALQQRAEKAESRIVAMTPIVTAAVKEAFWGCGCPVCDAVRAHSAALKEAE